MTRGNWQAWRELLRAANVFTAVSNVAAGALVAGGPWPDPWALLAAGIASALLYEAGMVLNDAFDAELDARERPERPLPSGRITRQAAFFTGWMLLAGGVAVASLASFRTASAGPLAAALCLAVMIVLYDSGLKQIWAGPLALGWCRTLNILLGGSIAPAFTTDPQAAQSLWIVAAAVGAYAASLTWLARFEVAVDSRAAVRGSLAVAALSLGVLAWWGSAWARTPWLPLWLLGVGVMIALVGGGIAQGLWNRPTPQNVRQQAGRMILGYLAIDAYLAGMSAGWWAAAAIASLAVPARLAARRTPMT